MKIQDDELDDELLDVPMIAAVLKCKKGLVYKLASEGTLPTMRTGRMLRVSRIRLNRWIAEQHSK